MKRILFILSAVLFANHSFCAAADYSQAITAGNFLYVSAQFPIDPSTGKMMEGEMEELTHLTIDHMKHWLLVKGYKMKDVIKTEVYLTDIRDYDAMNAAYAKRFHFQFPPARDVIVVPQLPNNSRIQISCIAYPR